MADQAPTWRAAQRERIELSVDDWLMLVALARRAPRSAGDDGQAERDVVERQRFLYDFVQRARAGE